MEWPVAAVIISIALGIIGAVVSIWTQKKVKEEIIPKIDPLLPRVERLEKQVDLMLSELLSIVRD